MGEYWTLLTFVKALYPFKLKPVEVIHIEIIGSDESFNEALKLYLTTGPVGGPPGGPRGPICNSVSRNIESKTINFSVSIFKKK